MKQTTIYKTLMLMLLMLLGSEGRVWAYGENTSYVCEESKEREFSCPTMSPYTQGEYPIDGPCNTVAFEVLWDGHTAFRNNKETYIEFYSNGKWKHDNIEFEMPSSRGTWKPVTLSIPKEYENATKIRLIAYSGATGYRKICNVKVTRATNISATTPSLDFGNQCVNTQGKQVAHFTFNNTTYPQQVIGTCTDSHFTVEPVDVGDTGEASVNVIYSSSTPGTHSGTVTLKMNGVETSFTVTGTSQNIFYFSATPEKIYDHGTVSANVEESIVGEDTDESKSAQATFTAVPNEDCTFHGWYYDAEHTQKVSDDATYVATIKNDAVGSTQNLTLYAWFKKNQTLFFTTDAFDKNIVCGQTEVGVATATASSGLPVTYSSSNDAVASVNEQGDVTGVAISNDDVIIIVTQEGNDEYNPATQIERAFHVVAKKEIGFSTEGLSGDYSTIHIDDKPTITVMNEGEGFTYASSQPDVVSIAKSGNVLTLTALKMGQSIITLTQPETDTHAKATKTYTITVEKKENTLAVTPVELATLVGNTIQLKLEGQNNTETPIVAQITEQSLASEVHQGEDVISYADGVITAFNAGTAKITFSQAESDQYKGYTSSAYEITVRKISNSITVMLNGNATPIVRLKYGATATLAYSSGHTESDFVVNKTSGSYTTLGGNIITAGNEAGNDVYEIVQAETYKYERGNTQFTVRVNNTDEEEGYVYTGWTDGSDKKILFTQTLDLTLSGYPDMMRFKAKQSGVTGCDIYYSTDGSNWVKFDDKDIVYRFAGNGDYADYVSVIPNRDARYIRFDPGAADHHFSEIYVTRKTFVEAASDKTDLGEVYTGETAQATVTVNYSTTNGGDIHISSNNPHFAVNKDEIATTKNSEGKQTFTVTYTPDPNNQEAEEASILVSDLFYSYEVKLTAKAIKRVNTLAVIEDQDLKVDDVITDVYQGKNSDATINCSVSKEGVITFDSETNSLKAIGAGEVTLTLTQAESDTHLGISKSLKVVVSKYDQTISWNKELSAEEVILKVGDHFEGNTAQASSGLELVYSSSNTDVIEVDAKTGALTAKAAGSDVVITATQMGNYKYNQASITRSFTVISKISATVRTSLLAEETNTLVVGETPVTIGCTATLTEKNFTIEGNEEGIVETSFADNTLTITPLKKGGPVVIKLTRSEDDSYLPLTMTFQIMVKNPELVLSPTAQQSVKAGEYSKVTLQRTLKAGYNSIALPLNTTVEKLVGESDGDNWVAQLSVVTYNAKDGYSLYFQKVTDGQIVANQPYILHLAKDVENPCFEDAEVVEATSAEHIAQKGSNANFWKMVSNYTPSLSMAGKYGVVNEDSCLKKGGVSSTLDAFAAYIEFTGGESQKVRTRFVDDEADVIADIQAGKGDTMVYDLQGRRLSKQSNGINIIRQSDGSVKKILK